MKSERVHYPWLFWYVVLRTWVLTALGGTVCALVSLGPASLFLCIYTVPIGFVSGAMLGLPLGLILATVVTQVGIPSMSPTQLRLAMRRVGLGVGWSVVALVVIWAFAFSYQPSLWLLGLLLYPGLAFGGIGAFCGDRLALGILRRVGLQTPRNSKQAVPTWTPEPPSVTGWRLRTWVLRPIKYLSE